MKPTIIDPRTTTRAEAFELWMHAPNPMVTFFKTLDVTALIRLSRKGGYKFNMLLCWCIGKAASQIKEFYLLPVGHELLQHCGQYHREKPDRRGQFLRCTILGQPRAIQCRLSASDASGGGALRKP